MMLLYIGFRADFIMCKHPTERESESVAVLSM